MTDGTPRITSGNRVLLATNQLERLSGSEVVIREWAEYFQRRGSAVSIFANWLGPPMQKVLRAADLEALDDPAVIRPLAFDLVYIQHHVAGLFDYSEHPDDCVSTTVIFGRLSPTGFMESGGWQHEVALGDALVANSPETARALRAAGTELPIHVSHNPAPEAFHRPRKRPLPEVPRSILVVTNHSDPSLIEAVSILRESASVLHLGRSGDLVAPVQSAVIRGHDLVISIGKTVQYALSARTPVFVYDYLGGPGYLTPANFDRAMDLNFSGRCTPRRPEPKQLVQEILAGYRAARDFALRIDGATLKRFYLPAFLDQMSAIPATSNQARRERLYANQPGIFRERLLAVHVRDSFRALQRTRRALARWQKK